MLTLSGPFSLMLPTCLLLILPVQDDSAFHEGPAISGFGKIANVQPDMAIPAGTRFRVRFDVSQQATPGDINGAFERAARFINLHIAAGVPRNNIQIAIVLHGEASLDVTNQVFYQKRNGNQSNASAIAVRKLLQNNVAVYLCGQSAAWYGIGRSDLLPGVQLALSAMTAHALLDQDGYSLNPF